MDTAKNNPGKQKTDPKNSMNQPKKEKQTKLSGPGQASERADSEKQVVQKFLQGEKEAILPLFHLYQNFFLQLAEKRLYNPENAKDIVSGFWMGLLNGKALSAYTGKNQSSLKHYLTKILIYRIIDENRKHEAELRYVKEKNAGCIKENISSSDQISGFTGEEETPEKKILKKESAGIFREALLNLEQIAPKDVELIRLRIKEYSFKEIARMQLGENADEKALLQKAEALKKQYTRKRTGSLEKLKTVFSRLLKKNKMTHKDIMDEIE